VFVGFADLKLKAATFEILIEALNRFDSSGSMRMVDHLRFPAPEIGEAPDKLPLAPSTRLA
jgi:hypothetical protein